MERLACSGGLKLKLEPSKTGRSLTARQGAFESVYKESTCENFYFTIKKSKFLKMQGSLHLKFQILMLAARSRLHVLRFECKI